MNAIASRRVNIRLMKRKSGLAEAIDARREASITASISEHYAGLRQLN